jgi:K+-transporting ATPase ATPase A chain
MANNGQALAGLNANSIFYNATTVIAMLAGRYGLAALALTLAGRFAAQRLLPSSLGSLPNDRPTFGALVFGTILLGGALCFLPALALGPIMEFLRQ